MDILNFISWIAGKKRVVNTVPSDSLIPIGIATPQRDDKYTTVAISTADFIAQVGPGTVGPTGAQGPAGPQGVPGPVGPAGLNWQGLWSALGVYADNDAVSFGGASYFCYNPLGIGPSASDPTVDTANWALLASQGAIGPQGPQGIQGIQGPGSASFASVGSFATSSITSVILTSILIPANTFTSQSAFTVAGQFSETSASYAGRAVFYINTTNTLVGATQLAISGTTPTITQIYYFFLRTFYINGSTTTGLGANVGNANDLGAFTVAPTASTIDWTVNQYFIVSGQVDNILGNFICTGVRIY